MLSREWVSFNADEIENWTQEQFEKYADDTFEMAEVADYNNRVRAIWTSKYIFQINLEECFGDYLTCYPRNWQDHPDLPAEWR